VRAAIHVVAKTSPKDGRIMSEGDVTPDVDARTSMDACMTFCCDVLLTDRSSILYTKHSAPTFLSRQAPQILKSPLPNHSVTPC
jgi:hypothetical protein